MIVKVVEKASANWALNQGAPSKETNIKISKEIAYLFEEIPNVGESFEIELKLFKDDFINSFRLIMGKLPLARSGTGRLEYFSTKLFEKDYAYIDSFFGGDNFRLLKAQLAKPKDHSFCLNFGQDTEFPIREFLLEGHSVLNFKKEGSIIELRVTFYNENQSSDEVTQSNETILQQITYGAPGTGKSHSIDKKIREEKIEHIRTTFHPDSDYASFVGAYKPTMKTNTITKNGSTTIEEQIAYSFVPQAFLKAYVGAWKQLPKQFYLVIEEINRGNCAQIFGDLFQLLDRGSDGFSSYPIKADEDIKQFLKTNAEEGLAALTEEQKSHIPEKYRTKVLTGEELVLPSNLYIWASMNTSDQSLFPIDSAFKRRWDWKYIPIANGNKNWKIEADNKLYDWWNFLEVMNDVVEEATLSEDKKLGYYFVKADENGRISAKKFVSKVLFYLWNDVFKDYGFDKNNSEDQPIFKDENKNDMTFRSFFLDDGEVNEVQVAKLMANLGINYEDVPTEDDNNDEKKNSQ